MRTYQDLQKIGNNEDARINFVYSVINEHEGSLLYEQATIADEYIRGRNREAERHQNMLTTSTGAQVVDKWSPNNKTKRNLFRRLVWEEVQYLLGNGVKWGNPKTVDKLGKDFDNRIREIARFAKIASICFGYFNYDHVEVFPVRSANGGFAPLYDIENGSLRAGVRFWRISDSNNENTVKTLRATLYEEDGITSYIWKDNAKGEVLSPKKGYKTITKGNKIDGTAVYDGGNYPSFPIVPMWGNSLKESELFMGLKDHIDAIDRISNDYINDLDNAQIYWIIHNAAGMDNLDVAKFLDQIRALKAANIEEGQVEPVTVNIPYAAREALITRLENAAIDDYMGLNIREVVGGAATATQIRAAYEPVSTKSGDFEEQVLDFLYKLMEIAGINDVATFQPIQITNVAEEVNTTLAEYGAGVISREYATERVLTLNGDIDRIEEVERQLAAADMARMSGIGLNEPTKQENEQEQTETDAEESVNE